MLPVESKATPTVTTPNVTTPLTSAEDVIQEESSDVTNTSSSTSLDPPLVISLDPPLVISLDPPPAQHPPNDVINFDVETLKTEAPKTDPIPRRTFDTVTGTVDPLEGGGGNTDPHKEKRKSVTRMTRSKTVASSESDESKYKTLPLPKQSQLTAVEPASFEQTDSGVRRYVEMMKKRGHKRTASAPVPSSPPVSTRMGGADWGTEEKCDGGGQSKGPRANLSNNR